MNLNTYNRSEGDLNFYNMDEYSKYSLFNTDSETYKDLLNTVNEIIPEEDPHLLTEQDASLIDMCSSFDKRMDFSDSQLLCDPYAAISPGAIGGIGSSMDSGSIPKLSTSERRREPKKTKKRTAKDQFSPPDSLYPDSNSLPISTGYSPFSTGGNYEDSYHEIEVPVINVNDNDQLTIFSDSDFRFNEGSLKYQSNNVTESNNYLFNTISNTNFTDSMSNTNFVDSMSNENFVDSMSNTTFAASIETEDSISQDFQDTEDIDFSNMSDAEKYRRLRDKNNEASKRYRRRKQEKISDLGHQIPELEEKQRKLKNKSEQLEALRNSMLQCYNSTFNRQYRPQEVLLLKR